MSTFLSFSENILQKMSKGIRDWSMKPWSWDVPLTSYHLVQYVHGKKTWSNTRCSLVYRALPHVVWKDQQTQPARHIVESVEKKYSASEYSKPFILQDSAS